MAKRNNVAMALQVARMAREILGGVGILDEHVSFRHMCNLESVYTYEGTDDMHLLILGEQLTKIVSPSPEHILHHEAKHNESIAANVRTARVLIGLILALPVLLCR